MNHQKVMESQALCKALAGLAGSQISQPYISARLCNYEWFACFYSVISQMPFSNAFFYITKVTN